MRASGQSAVARPSWRGTPGRHADAPVVEVTKRGAMAGTSAPPVFSVVMPVYNGARWLREAVGSVLSQQDCPFELLIADDGSTDGSRQVLCEFDDPRLRVFHNPANLNLFGNCNFLLGRARGEFVRFLCQDDALRPGCLAAEARFYRDRPDAAFAFCKCEVVDETGARVSNWAVDDLPDVLTDDECLQYLYHSGCIPGNLSTVSCRRSAIVAAGMFDTSFPVAGDFEMWARLVMSGRRMGVIHRRLIRLRSHAGQLSRSGPSGLKFVRECQEIRRRIEDLLPRAIRGAARSYHRLRLDRLDFNWLLSCLRSGSLVTAAETMKVMGLRRVAWGGLFWMLTLGGRLHHRGARYAVDAARRPTPGHE